jgi:hypothetical protein
VGPAAYYRSDDVTTFPWQATTWTAVGVGTPVPIFSQQSTAQFQHRWFSQQTLGKLQRQTG